MTRTVEAVDEKESAALDGLQAARDRGYEVDRKGRLCFCRFEGDNVTHVPLCNFDARIVEEVEADDGAEVVRQFRLQGVREGGRAFPEACVLASEFGSLQWVVAAWGAQAVVAAGPGARDRLREAIQLQSSPVRSRVYRHTGWREVETGVWAFLHHGGAIGAEGVAVELAAPLDRFAFPESEPARLLDAVRVSLSMLDCGPPAVMIPLLGAVYLAPLMPFVLPEPDFVLWLFGMTGNLKSELAALAQQHFGAGFTRARLPASFEDTENSIEGAVFAAKDVVCVVDDFAPQADSRAQRQLERKAQRLVRSAGNGSGRGRLNADLSQRPKRPPRAIVICTGEDLPPGASIGPRLVQVEVDKAALDLVALATLQQRHRELSHAMRGYIEWLLPQRANLIVSLPREWARVREQFQGCGSHLRQAPALAHLYVGFNGFLEFAHSIGALDEKRVGEWLQTAETALRGLGDRQAQQQNEADIAERFMEILRTRLAQGHVALLDKGDDLARAAREGSSTIRCEFLGWKDGEYAYLLPEPTRKVVMTFLREAGESWSPTAYVLNKALVKRSYVRPGSDGRPVSQHRVGPLHGAERHRERVLQVPLSVLEPSDEDPAAPVSTAGSGRSIASSSNGDRATRPLTDGERQSSIVPSPLSPPFLMEEGAAAEMAAALAAEG